jgi:hypothetical protein
MRELNVNEIEQVNGGLAFALGYGGAFLAAAGTTFRASYETATFFGAGKLGSWIGREVYSALHDQ